jgi:hypothetical protein
MLKVGIPAPFRVAKCFLWVAKVNQDCHITLDLLWHIIFEGHRKYFEKVAIQKKF